MSQTLKPSGNVVVVGAGNVGASIAFSLVSEEIANEILIIDIAHDLARGQVADLQDASDFSFGTMVNQGDYTDLKDGDIVVITAGAAQKDGQTRLDLLQINVKIMRSILSQIKATNKNLFLIIVSNPVDILTQLAIEESGLSESQVFGSGTYLDTGRLRVHLSKKLGVNPHSVHAYVMGEHGNSSFPVLSKASIGGIPLEKFMDIENQAYEQIAETVRKRAYEIIADKQSTNYGIGAAVGELCRIILRNEKRILAISTMAHGYYGQENVCFGMPVRLGSDGVKFLGEISLNNHEKKMLDKSCELLKESRNLVVN